MIGKMGWLRDYPDFRDYTVHHPKLSGTVDKMKLTITPPSSLAVGVDLRVWCSPIEDQGNLGSCVANAACGVVEYFEKRAYGKYLDASRLFLYKVARNLAHLTGDTGLYIRQGIGALVLFGIPPEEYYPYDVLKFDNEPSAFCYSFAQDYKAINYWRVDSPGLPLTTVLNNIKTNLIAGFPMIFGFTVYSSFDYVGTDGKIPFPTIRESVLGGHSMVIIGYDDTLQIKNPNTGGITTTGAFLIRNSWGTSWGMKGYGWMPYQYLLSGIADDFWTMTKQGWIDTGNFGFNDL
jgi:C1A family cysteine protease